MPKTITADEVLARLDWIKKLPDKGGSWGKSTVETATTIAKEVDEMGAQIETLSAKRAERMKVLRRIPVRARYDAKHLFDESILAAVLPPEEPAEK